MGEIMENPISPWSEEDSNKIIEYLNLVATHAKFNVSTQELIKYFKCLNWMQHTLLNKIKDSSVSDVTVRTKEELKGKPKKG